MFDASSTNAIVLVGLRGLLAVLLPNYPPKKTFYACGCVFRGIVTEVSEMRDHDFALNVTNEGNAA